MNTASVIDPDQLRRRVIAELIDAGFEFEGGRLSPTVGTPDEVKQASRERHANQRREVLLKNAALIDRWEDRLLEEFADGREINPYAIDPVTEAVVTERDAALFRLASLHWSVPVSQGYGRRSRFLIRDAYNGKLIGIFALGDPVFNLGVRDRLIGWDGEQRQARLYNCYDAYVLGAVEPYRYLIAGKLAALLAVSNEVADFLAAKYDNQLTVIKQELKSGRPVLISTTSALGRSSIYNRLKVDGKWAFRSVGYTEGFGHFHFSDDLFDSIVQFIRESGHDLRGSAYGKGPNWRIRTLRTGLDMLGLSGDLLRHGVRREVFLAPRGSGWRAFLRGESDRVNWFDYNGRALGDYWRERWAIPRSERDDRWFTHRRDSMRLAPLVEDLTASAGA